MPAENADKKDGLKLGGHVGELVKWYVSMCMETLETAEVRTD